MLRTANTMFRLAKRPRPPSYLPGIRYLFRPDSTHKFPCCCRGFHLGLPPLKERLIAVSWLHGVLIDIVGDLLAHPVADFDCARVMHPAPNPRVVPVRARLRDA